MLNTDPVALVHKLRPREVGSLLWVADGICETQVVRPEL